MNSDTASVLRKNLASGRPFLLYILPDEADVRVATNPTELIRPWPGTGGDMLPVAGTTPKDMYISRLSGLISTLRTTGGKTVIARNISGKLKHELPELVAGYFPLFPNCLRYFFHIPETGYWFGATPELLLVDDGTILTTRALAGTRRRGEATPWSAKNLREHRFVVDDISARLQTAGIIAEYSAPVTVQYGTVEHLATDFRAATVPEADFRTLVGLLHPTPAVGGLPRNTALAQIAEIESSPRRYYAGTITICDGSRRLAYVILRCVHTDGKYWSIYTGSGITGDSSPDDEWAETEAKAAPLLHLLS